MVFDGKQFAATLTQQLKTQIGDSKLKTVAFLDPTNAGSVVYTNLKAKKASELGVEFVRVEVLDGHDIAGDIDKLNEDATVQGVMIQLPLKDGQALVSRINPRKDIDGLRDDSPYKSAVVRAVRAIYDEAHTVPNASVVIVGSAGKVGQRLLREFPGSQGMDKTNFDTQKLLEADVIISATGSPGLITPEMVKEGVVAIDVGYPVGDFAPEVASKSAFFTPVPGGVGPVTVVMLFANLSDIE